MADLETLARRWVWGQADHECGGRNHKGDCFKCDSVTASLVALLRSRDERALRIVREVYREYGAKSIEDEDLAHGAETACREIKRRLEESDG